MIMELLVGWLQVVKEPNGTVRLEYMFINSYLWLQNIYYVL